MTFKNGKFYNDSGEMVPLEFGNKEQIALIERANDFKVGVWNPFGKIKCLCGEILNYSENDIGKDIECQLCKNKFAVREDEEDGLIVLKMK